jgi:hypothetical protein
MEQIKMDVHRKQEANLTACWVGLVSTVECYIILGRKICGKLGNKLIKGLRNKKDYK